MGLRDNGLTRTVDLGKVRVADTYFSRLVGLMGRRDLHGVRVLFPDCRSVHTCFMLVPIDLVFVDRSRQVVELLESVNPWRFVGGGERSHAVFEMQSGSIKELGIQKGDLIEWQ